MAIRAFWILSALIATGVVAWGWALTPQSDDETQVQSAMVATSFAPPVANQIISPLPQNPQQLRLDDRKVELGRKLFHDKRLSHDDSIACASCHPLNKMGVDGLPLSPGIKQQFGQLNTPTVFNTGFNFRQFWDGRAADLEEQASGPVHNPVEMASNWPEVIAKLKQDAYYPKAFRAIWPDGIQPQHIQSAIAEFERGLITPDSPFDRYLRGETNALSEEAQRGWSLFRNLGCVACHQGINVGGNMYANLGVMGDFFEDRGIPETKADQGRFNLTKRPEDRHLFKVPSLRNVARTAPYFHDGSIATLDKAVDAMARYQLGVMLEKAERDDLIAFLQSLSGRIPAELAQAGALVIAPVVSP